MVLINNKIIKTFLIGAIIFLASCAKEKDTIGIIQVVNTSGQPVSGATVTLNQEDIMPGTTAISDLKKTSTTDLNGRASFTYQYEAILDVSVEKISPPDTYLGSNVIRLLRGKTTTITVEIVKQ